MNWASVILLLVFFGYTAVSWSILGPLDSISETYYKFRDRGYSAAFNIFGFLVFLACAAQTYYPYKHTTLLMFVLSGAFVWGLTVASLYRTNSMQHYLPTLLSIICGFLAVFFEYRLGFKFYTALGGFIVLAVGMKIAKVPYYTTWVELLALVAILFWFLI